MILVILKGGLGNQMFQYAFGLYLARFYNTDLFLEKGIYLSGTTNRLYDLDIFQLPEDVRVGTIKDLADFTGTPFKMIRERQFSYDSEMVCKLQEMKPKFEDKKSVIGLDGYFQSYKYFQPIADLIKQSFSLDLSFDFKLQEMLSKIISTNSVMINVRRGDYLWKLDYHGVVDQEYLLNSIAIMSAKTLNPVFYVFSDDIPWCRAALKNIDNIIFVDESYYGHKYSSYFKLMQSCKHFIIANSTFCWWAVWLSDSPGKIIIAPQRWFTTDSINAKDLIPSDWISV